MRKAENKRETKETKVDLKINIDGEGQSFVTMGIPFWEHMLTLFFKHSFIDAELKAKGDIEVDSHHTLEDIGIVLGQSIKEALGDKSGITRYGFSSLPMDEALVQSSIDISNRPMLVFNSRAECSFSNVQLCEEFLRAVAYNAGLTLHINILYGNNEHHIAEAVFKAFAVSLRKAVRIIPSMKNHIPSTKGVL